MLCMYRDVYLDSWVDGSVLNTHVSCLFWLKLESMYLCVCVCEAICSYMYRSVYMDVGLDGKC